MPVSRCLPFLSSQFWSLFSARRQPRRKFPLGQVAPADIQLLESRLLLTSITVTNLNDSGAGSLRAAVATANSEVGADTIRFKPGLAGTIRLTTGQLELTDDVTIAGPGAGLLTISGNQSSRIFTLAGPTVTISGLTLAHGQNTLQDSVGIVVTRGGAILNDGGHLTLLNDTFRNNVAVGPDSTQVVGGGAVVNSGSAELTVSHCTFLNNTARGGQNYAFGGAIANVTNSTALITDSVFIGNLATGATTNYGGALGNFGNSQMTVRNSTFIGNQARGLAGVGEPGQAGFGGAIATRPGTVNDSGSTTTIQSSVFVSNQAIGGAGGTGQNGGDAGGGALFNNGSELIVTSSSLTGNVSVGGTAGKNGGAAGRALGGAVSSMTTSDANLPTTRLTQCVLLGNVALGGTAAAPPAGIAAGGAVYNTMGSLQVGKSQLIGNVAVGGLGAGGLGGGLFNGDSINGHAATATVTDSLILGNAALGGARGPASGGGIHNGNLNPSSETPVVTLTRTTVAGNVAIGHPSGVGGGIATTGTFFVTGPLQSPTGNKIVGNAANSKFPNVFGELTQI
ncbi:MAG: hypothetical protein JSS02_09355 [Planctomycetes bacterium]|nr:hypothetical protein [Planctomycetota bacterium]